VAFIIKPLNRQKLSTEWTVQCLGNTEKKIRNTQLVYFANFTFAALKRKYSICKYWVFT
jgi:hypothetical protein